MNSAAVKVWGAVAVVLVLVFVFLLIGHTAATANYKHDLQDANARVRLYAAAEGRSLSEPSVERKLGADVYAYAKAHSGHLDGFRADTNSYGGITDAIGEDPFDGINCSECGPLKPEWQERLESATQGKANLPNLIDRPTKPGNPARSVGVLLLLWAFVLPLLLVGSRILDHRRRVRSYSAEDYHLLSALDQQLEQGSDDPDLQHLRAGLQNALNERANAGKTEKTEMLIDRLKSEARDRLEALEAGNRYFDRRE
jgi:hypothetical protein